MALDIQSKQHSAMHVSRIQLQAWSGAAGVAAAAGSYRRMQRRTKIIIKALATAP